MSSDDKKKTVFIQIERDDHRVKDVINMGKNVGVPFREWYAVLKTATLLVEEIFAEKGIGYFVEIETGCDCENCKANRKDYEAIRKRGGSMSSINGMRSPMIKGPRREAKTVVTDFVLSAIGKIENGEQVPDSIRDQLIVQLKAMQHVAEKMNWTDLAKRIKRALAIPAPRPFGIEPMSQEQINAHSYAQANECTPADYFKSMGKPVPPWAT